VKLTTAQKVLKAALPDTPASRWSAWWCVHPWTVAVGDRIGHCADVGAAFLPLIGIGSDLFMRRRERPCRRGLVLCHVHPDCMPSLAIARRCALDGTPAQVAH